MPFQIIRNDITRVRADAIVNTANPKPVFGRGTDRAVYIAAGEEALLKERRKIGELSVGEAAATKAFGLKARYIIHTAGPVWQGGNEFETEKLASCYRKSLHLAAQLGCKSIAFPLISAGNYGFPKEKALETALSEIRSFLTEAEMDVTLVVFDRSVFELSKELTDGVAAYIDEKYVEEKRKEEYGSFDRKEETEQIVKEEEQAESESEIIYTGSAKHDTGILPDLSGEEDAVFGAGLMFPEESYTEHEIPEDYTVSGKPQMPDYSVSNMPPMPEYSISSEPPMPDAAPAAPKPAMHAAETSAAAQKPAVHAAETSAAASKPAMHTAPSEKTAGAPAAAPVQAATSKRRSKGKGRQLSDLLKQTQESFQESLLRRIDERGLTDVEVYKKANIDRKLFSKIRSNPSYQPKKRTAIALAIALELNMDETIDLIGRAGLALSPASKADLIIEYCIENRIYDLFTVNSLLFEYDQPLLGI